METTKAFGPDSPAVPGNAAAPASACAREGKWDRILPRGLFALLVIFHLWAVSVGWESGMLLGNEFRQSQTALTTLFIQREGNFSLAYPTPVLGKPWSVPMEFPLYQWTVAKVSSSTGWTLTETARAVSCVCFYLTLPAIWLLLKRLRLSPSQVWIALGVMLTCPLYIFYARAFLIETMALMFSLWFLQGFIAAVEQRSPFWLAVANLAGIGAGLVKVTTFMLYAAPAGLVACVWLWRASSPLRNKSGESNLLVRTVAWAGGCVVLPFAATLAWIKFSDAVKALNPSGAQLVSSSMSSYHFGTWQTRLSSEPWVAHGQIITTNIMPLASFAIFAGVALAYGGRWRKWIGAMILFFLAGPLTFPVLYSWHEYYFVANAVALLAAVGLALAALAKSSAPRWSVWAAIVGLNAFQCWGYFHYLYPTQRLPYLGGSGLTRLLRDMTDRNDVLLIHGNDWSSVIPFYSERRALMIRTNLDHSPEYLDRAFSNIADESVPILILVGDQRNNRAFLERAVRQFDFDPQPLLIHKTETVYVARAWRNEYIKRLFNVCYNDVSFANPKERLVSNEPQAVSAMRDKRFFSHMDPQPKRYQVPFGLSFGFRPNGAAVFDAHAPTRLWFSPATATSQLSMSFGITEEAYTRSGDHTDGVEFVVVARSPDGTERTVFSRLLDPVRHLQDRGTQMAQLSVTAATGTELVFETRPGASGSNAFDWAYWSRIELH